jgi:hypothetical protein
MALELGCRPLAVLALRRLGEVLLSLARREEATPHLRQALELARQTGMAGEAAALETLLEDTTA